MCLERLTLPFQWSYYVAQAGFSVPVWALPLIWHAIQVPKNLRISPKTQDLEFGIALIILLLRMRGHEF